MKEQKPPIVNQQSVVYYFKCDLCDADYVGYSCRHLHQRIEEHKGSAIGRHIREQHGKEPDNIEKNFKILRKCQSKLDCLIFEMLFIGLLKPKLNKQSDSLRAKLFLGIIRYFNVLIPVALYAFNYIFTAMHAICTKLFFSHF